MTIRKILKFIWILWVFNLMYAQTKDNANKNIPIPFTLEDKERLIRMELTLQQHNERFDMIQTQINSLQTQINSLQTQINSLQTQINSLQTQINSLQNFLYILAGMLITSVITIVGFVLWDRRTFLKPFQHKTEDIEKEFMLQKKEHEKLLKALRKLAETNEEIKTVLKQFHLL